MVTHAEIKLLRSLRLKKNRDELGLFVAEGDKCIEELAKTFEIVRLYALEGGADRLSDRLRHVAGTSLTPTGDGVLRIATPKEIEQMSSLRAPQGSIAVLRKPQESEKDVARWLSSTPLALVLDEVQDPGNVGTILRTADWFGIRHVFCSEGTADCFGAKVVQATMGALARVKVHYMPLRGTNDASIVQLLLQARRMDIPVYGTLLDGHDMYAEGSIERADSGLIVMGNEGNGLSVEVREMVSHPLRIPSYPPNVETSESLNVAIATAVVLAEFRRRAVRTN